MKEVEIGKVLFPQSNKLIINDKENTVSAVIIDVELDPIKVLFNNDDCATIDTSKYKNIVLSAENLFILMDLIEEAREYYNNLKD